MGTAGLDTKRLSNLLERLRIEVALIEGDRAFDHCVLRLSSVKRPSVAAFIEYENKGTEPRLVGLVFRSSDYRPEGDEYPLDWEKMIRLEGSRKNDPDKIAQWIEREFLPWS